MSLATGAIDGWDKRNQFYFQMIQSLAHHYKFDVNVAWETCLKSQKVVLHGSGKEVIDFTYLSERGTTFNRSHAFEGIIPNLERRYRETDSETVREKLREYQNHRACPSCGGARLRKEARYVYVGGEPLHEVSAWPLTKTHRFFETLDLDGNKNRSPKKSSKKSPSGSAS
ncbi:excinuclease ABC subunit A [Neisseria gonorrhoeae]|uniref:Excinuclease ABC subunit A n=1 Tax=Neisseria gonorrhoeae TaxID=485 RepID=A0A378VVM0_NEIGO|nr:excinuclease ABC subunit A [Neisseria gonorrhoeae]